MSAPRATTALGVAFFSHGGGPMPLMGRDPTTVESLHELAPQIARGYADARPPTAIILVSAHYQKQVPHVLAAARPKMVFDYGGFPEETYEYKYPAPGNPDLARRIVESMKSVGLTNAVADETWGYDHGVFVPLMILFPEAQVPVVNVSVLTDEDDTARHFALGEALQPFVAEGAVVLGSGSSFHNFSYFFGDGRKKVPMGFSAALHDALTNSSYDAATRKAKLSQWRSWPDSYEYHPRGGGDHFLPLLVAAAAAKYQPATWISQKKSINSVPVANYGWIR